MKHKFGQWSFESHYIKTVKTAKEIVSQLVSNRGKLYGLDIETAKLSDWKENPQAGLDPYLSRIRLLQIYDGVKNVYVFDLFVIPIKVLAPLLQTGSFVAHNAMFEILHITHAGYPNVNIGCSMILSQIIQDAEVSPYDPPEDEEEDNTTGLAKYRRVSHSLDGLVQRLFGVRVAKEEQVSDWSKKELSESQISYAALDALLTYVCAKELVKKLKEHDMVRYYHHLKSMQQVIADIQLRGIPVDWDYHKTLVSQWQTTAEAAEKACAPYFKDINMRSSKQMNEWLKTYLKDDPITLASWPRTKTGYGFGKTVITAYRHLPAISALLNFKITAKLLDTYGDSLATKAHPITRRLHTSYTLAQTRTGRMSSREPNCQNFPRDKEFRNLFRADDGHVIVVSDFSQIELRLQAEFSRDPRMCDVYREGRDIYCEMASVLFNRPITKADKKERFVGKTCFSGDTEILTIGGWIRLDQYNGGPVVQYELPIGCTVKESARQHVRSSRFNQAFKFVPFTGVGGELKFVNPTGYIIRMHQNTTEVQDRNISICATHDHTMYWMHDSNMVVNKGTFSEMLKQKSPVVIAAGYMNKRESLSEIETRILAMVVADGSFSHNSIRFGFVKRRKVRRCIELFKQYGIKVSQKTFKQHDTSTGLVTKINISNKELVEKLLEYTTDKKELSWKCLTDIPGKIYLEEAQFWDAHKPQRKRRTSVLFSTTVEQTADVMQAMAVTEGVSITKTFSSGMYQLCYSLEEKCTRRFSMLHRVRETQDVYCVSVPSGMLLIRRNGRICVQGNCMLALGYGMGPTKLQMYATNANAGNHPLKFWEEAHAAYHRTFSTYSKWCDRMRFRAKKLGYIETLLGKRRKLSEDEVYTRAPNTVIQGTAAELMGLAMKLCNERIKGMVATVHDEILLHVPEKDGDRAKTVLASAMNDAMKQMFPKAVSHHVADAAFGVRWGDAKGEI